MNEMTISNGNNGLMETSAANNYCSFNPTTQAEKVKLFNAVMNPDERIKDHVNETILIKDFIVELVTLDKKDDKGNPVVDDETGEVIQQEAPRIVILDDKGKSYTATSMGMFSALKRIVSIFGEPNTWEAPIKVKIKMISRGTRNMLNLEMVK